MWGRLISDCCVPPNPCALIVQVLWTNNEVAVEHCLRLFSRRGLGPVSKDAAGFQSCWFQWKSLSMTLSQSSVIFSLVFLQIVLLWIQSSCNVSYQSNFPSKIGKFCELFFQMKMRSMWWYLFRKRRRENEEINKLVNSGIHYLLQASHIPMLHLLI